jgi:MYXO-CTERM domain-containing protein
MRARKTLVVLALTIGGAAATTQAGVIFGTDTPAAPSTAANPLVLEIFNNNGVAVPVNVTNILVTDTAAQKATKIKNAINTQTGFPAVSLGNGISVNNTSKVRLRSDPTKEKFDSIKGDFAFNVAFGANTATVCTGLDPGGLPSLISVGIEGQYIASIIPTLGQSASSILTMLASDLTSHGIAATYSPGSSSLSLTNSLTPLQNFIFGNSDTGFSSFGEVTVAPAPGSLALLAGAGLITARRRRR